MPPHPALLLLLLPASSLLLQSAPSEVQTLGTLGVGGGIAGLILMFYRADRKESEIRLAAAAKASEDRIAAFAQDFREVIENNTVAMTRLVEQDGRPARKHN